MAATVPRTRVPCLFPKIKNEHPGINVLTAKCNVPEVKNIAFATVLRTLLGATGEFAFLSGKNSVVWVDGIEEDEPSETLKVYDVASVDGIEQVETKISLGEENDNVALEGSVLFHLQVQTSSIVLVYSSNHIPESFARLLLGLYIQESTGNRTYDNLDKGFDGLSVLNYPPSPYPNATQKYTLLHEGLVAHSILKPHHIAVDYLGASEHDTRRTLTYEQLGQRSLVLASFLYQNIPLGKKTIIPLMLPPSTELYIAYIGVLRSGHAFSPLPGLDSAPVTRIIELISDMNAPLVLGIGVRPDWMDSVPHVGWKDVTDLSIDEETRQTWPSPKVSDVAYVLFTSGSTGKPKGVQITHMAVSASIASHLAVRSLPENARWFQFAASTFDPSLMEIFMTFWSGTTLCAADRKRFLTDPESVLRMLKCTHMMATPSMAAMLRPENIGDRFELWTMGEKLLDQVIDAFSRPEKGYTLCNAYGPTEAAINVTLRVHPRNESGARLGAPISSATMVVLHPTKGKLVPLGFPGELGLIGVQLAKGYLNMPEQTAKAFVQVEDIGRVYRTGDRARVCVDENGEWKGIEYLGRIGMGQVKLAGRRVELGEIDAVLSDVAGIQAAHSVVINDQLYALLIPANDALISMAFASAESRLPAHMRPVSYVLANSIPKSTAGKASRPAIIKLITSALAEAEASNSASSTDVDSESLKLVVKLISQVADIDERIISNETTLLALGIDSLRGVRFLRLARDAGITGLTIQNLLGRATPISVARAIAEHREVTPKNCDHLQIIENFVRQASPAVQREYSLSEKYAKILPTTPMQASVLAMYLRSPKSTGYLNHSIYTLANGIDLPRFKSSWEEVVRRNAILRTSFVLVDDSDITPFAQVIFAEPHLEWVELVGADIDALIETHLRSLPEKVSLRFPSAVSILRNENSSDVRFVLTLHHSLFDGGSLALMLEELFVIYSNTQQALQRASFEHGIADALNVDTQKCTQYWHDELAGFSPDYFPDLSGLREEAKSSGHHASTIISSTSFARLRSNARQLQTTPLSIVQAAWGLLLLTYSESESPDIVFGSVVGGRTSEDLEYTVGPVFSTVPIRMREMKTITTKGVLSTLLNKNAASLRHRYPPVKLLSGEKGLIYDTTIALQNFGEGLSQTDLWTNAEYPPMETEFAVVLEIWVEQDDSIRLRATSSNNVLVPAATESMLQQFDNLISGIMEQNNQDRPFLDVITTIKPNLQSSINPVPQAQLVPETSLLHHQFEDNCRVNPDKLALWFKSDLAMPSCDVQWTYRELNARANQLANYLISIFGDIRDQAIPICMEKCPDLYVAILGIVKAGGAWCPVDVDAPEKRKRDLFSRAGGPVVLVRDEVADLSLRTALPDGLVMFRMDDTRLSAQPEDAPCVEVSSGRLAYLIWTSGTTSLPKGVPIEHGAAVQSLTTLQAAIPYNRSGVRCLNFSAYTFDVSVLDIFYVLGTPCGTLCSAPKDILVGQFVEAVHAFAATHAFLTPAFMAQSSLSECKSLESLISIGEKLPDSVADKWSRPGTVSLNTYGPAEATIIATYRRFQPNEKTKAQNVGLPIQTVSCFGIDDGRIVPRGAVGELALGGYQNARGYHLQPDMTAKKFVQHPVAGHIYMTGDIVRFLHDGTCEFVGRNDDLVKLGGIRVELSEITSVLKASHPQIQDATTIQLARPDRPQKVVCTFLAASHLSARLNICTDDKAVELVRHSKEYAEQYLPIFMQPTVIIVVQNLPLTPSNKIDRKNLADIYSALDISSWETALGGVQTDNEGWSVTETKIQAVVSELTGSPLEWIKKTTPFPALGVDSLRALQLASRLRKAGISVSVRDVITHSSTGKLGRFVARRIVCDNNTLLLSPSLQKFDALWRPTLEGVLDSIERVLPCTPLQEGMLGETMKNPAAYWSHRLFELEPFVDIERVKFAWQHVTTRTEVLRLVFLPAAAYGVDQIDSSTIFLQVVLSTPTIQFSVTCCHQDVMRHASEHSSSVSNSWTGSTRPPWSIAIFNHEQGRTMMLSIHHALYDGTAMDLILDQVQSVYYGGPSFRDHVQLTAALSASLFAHDAQKSQAFWDETLIPFADPHTKPWPVLLDRACDEDAPTKFMSHGFTTSLKQLSWYASQFDASVGHVLQAAWSFILASYLNTTKVVFGETMSLRMGDASLDHAIAPLITTSPVIASVTSSTVPQDLIRTLALLSSRSAPHRLVSMQRMRKTLCRQTGQPVFCTIFVLFNEDNDDSYKVSIGPTNSLWSACKEVKGLGVEHPLAINVYVTGDTVRVNVLGSDRFMSDGQIKLLTLQYQEILALMLQYPAQIFSRLLDRLDNRHLSVILPVVSPIPCHNPVLWLEHHATTYPNRLAFVMHGPSGKQWSFKEFNEASNRVANWIDRHHHASIIALSMPKSDLSTIYQLGIFKAGNTYVPIDDTVCASRKRLLVRATMASVVLTISELTLDFVDIEDVGIVAIDQPGHLHAVAEEPSSGREVNSEMFSILFTENHRMTRRACKISSTSLVATIEALVNRMEGTVSTSSRFLTWMPFALEGSLVELFLSLRLGVTAVYVPHNELQQNFPQIVSKTDITHAFVPPSWFHEDVRHSDMLKLRCIVLIGPPLPTPITLDRFGLNIVILNAFGFPETASICTVGTYRQTPAKILGYMLDHLCAVVVRPGSCVPVLKGAVGELCIAVSKSYTRGLQDRYLQTKHGRMFNTGVLVRVLADNAILYVARQLLLPYNLETSEMIQLLTPQKFQVHTLALNHPEGVKKYVVTFISRSWDPSNTHCPSIASKDLPIAQSLQIMSHRLPSHLIPDMIVPLDFIPYANILSGAVDAQALRRLFSKSPADLIRHQERKAIITRSLTEVEKQIRHILSLATSVPEEAISNNTSTLELGVDSLTAISLSFRLKSAGFFVPPHVILSGPSLEVLARASRPALEPEKSTPKVASVDEAVKSCVYDHLGFQRIQDVLPCLPLQEGLVARTLNSENTIYVNHFVMRIETNDIIRLISAFSDTIQNNDILRTCFYIGDHQIVQVILTDSPALRKVQVAAGEDPLSSLRSDLPFIERDVVQKMDRLAPIRLSLYSSSESTSSAYICLTMHHAIYDGESLPMLLQEVRERYYSTFSLSRSPISHLLNYLASQQQEVAKEFYVNYLRDARAVSHFVDMSKISPQRDSLTVDIPLSILEQVSRALNVSLHVLVMTAFGIALGEHRGHTDSVFGVVLSGRTVLVEGIDNLLAPCITTVPIRVRLEGNEVFADIVAQVQREASHVFEHQHTPLRSIQRWVGSTEPLFDTLFSYNKVVKNETNHGLWSLLESQAVLDYPLAVAAHADLETDLLTLSAGYDRTFGSLSTLLSRIGSLLGNLNQTIDAHLTSLSPSPSASPVYDASTWSSEETLIQRVVSEVCNIEPEVISKDTSFLHLGIDSITSIRLAQRLRSLNFIVPTFAIMQYPCIGALVHFWASSTPEGIREIAQQEFVAIQAMLMGKYMDAIPRLSDLDEITTVFPATPLQVGMLTQSLSGAGQLYLFHHAFLLSPAVSLSDVRHAWEKVISSTDILRSSFHPSPDPSYPWIGAVHSNAPIRWMESTASSEQGVREIASKIERYDVIEDALTFQRPPISFHVISSPDMRVLVVTMHHSLYDGLSFSYIMEDVATAYHKLEVLERPQFTDAIPFILHNSKDDNGFWQSRLKNFRTSLLAKRHCNSGNLLGRSSLFLPEGSKKSIMSMGVTVQAVALLAWGKTLSTLVDSLDVVFGQVVAGRSIELHDSLRASGPLFNTIPFRFTLADPTWSNLEALKTQHALNVQAEAHHHVPLRRIQRDWRIAQSTRESLFDTLFVFQQSSGKSDLRTALWSSYSISEEASSAQYPLSLEVIHTGDSVEFRAGCQADVLSKPELDCLLALLRDVFLNIIEHPGESVMSYPSQLSDIPSASPLSQSSSQVVRADNRTYRDFTPVERLLLDVFSAILNIPVPKIKLDTPLYALGMDSVAAIQIAAKCRSEGLGISVADIFVGETIAGIGAAYDCQDSSAGQRGLQGDLIPAQAKNMALDHLGLGDSAVEDVLPVLPGQLYHLASWLACGGTFYQPVFVYRVTREVDIDKLAQAWKHLQDRHAILRTVFVAISPSATFQVIIKPSGSKSTSGLSIVDVQGKFDEQVKKQVQKEYHQRSTLFVPPARLKLVRVGTECALLLSLHHSTYDAWTVPRLVSDLCAIYDEVECQSSLHFPEFVRYVSDTTDDDAQRDFWRATLNLGASSRSLLLKRHNCPELRHVFISAAGVVPAADSLHAICQAAGSSLQAITLAAWGRITAKLTDSKSPILGVYHTGRAASFDGLEVLAGPCVNVLPMQIPTSGRDIARYIQGQLGLRSRFEQSSLRDINEWLENSGPLFNVFINLLWHGDRIRSIRTGNSLLESYSVGVPSTYSSEAPLEMHTSVDALDVSYIPKAALFVDVVLNSTTNSLGLAIRCHEVLLNESELHHIASQFAKEVHRLVDELK